MASNRIRRVQKELKDIAEDKDARIFAAPANGDDINHLIANFPGPQDTPYEGGTYFIDVKIPSEYPFRPPVMQFMTKVWHPNISSQTGAICLDTLGTAWSPVLTIRAALLSLQSLLSTPEPKDPQDAEVAMMLMHHPDQFRLKAREWAVKHANAPKTTDWSKSSAAMQPMQSQSKPKPHFSREEELRMERQRYQGYNKDLIDRFVNMGFDIDRVVDAFIYVNIDRNNGQDYELEEAYMGDITARLLGEP